MKRIIALILSLSITVSLVCVTVFADGASGNGVLSAAEERLYGMYTKQTGDALRDCYGKAVASATAENAATLEDAISGLKPLETYTKSPLYGFESITDEDIAAMKLIRGTASAADGYVTLEGTSGLRYCNAADSGIAGASPFGTAMNTCDGIAICTESATAAKMDFAIGKRGSADDCTFGIYDVCIPEGKSYSFFPFECFGRNIPLDGTLNYISLTFTGTERVSFGDLHAVADSTETAKVPDTSIEKLTGSMFDAEDYYRIYQKDTKLALTFITDDLRTNEELVFTDENPDDRAQEWQIVSSAALGNRKLVINRKYGHAMYIAGSPAELKTGTVNLSSQNYGWSITYSKSKGFSFGISNAGKLSYSSAGSARAASPSSVSKGYDIYRVPGERWNLTWSEEFDGDEVDRSVWNVYDCKNRGEYEPFYSRDSKNNLYIEDGSLILKTIVEEYKGYHATSAFLDTAAKVHVTYGRIESRVKMPQGEHIWPAVWMMGDDEDWPYNGEVDIVEMVGGEDTSYRGDSGVINTIHYPNGDGTKAEQGGLNNGTMRNNAKLADDYHLYCFEWDSKGVRWYFDNILTYAEPLNVDPEKYTFVNNPLYLILGNGIEGPGQNRLPEGVPDESFFCVDYIRYYKEECSAVPESVTVPKPADKVLRQTPYGLTRGASYSRDNDIFAMTSYSNSCPVYDMKTGNCLINLRCPRQDWMMSSALSPDASLIAVAQLKGTINLLKVSDNTALWRISMLPFRTAEMKFSADGNHIIIGTRPASSDGKIYAKKVHVLSAEDGHEVLSFDVPSTVERISVSKTGNVAVGCCDGTVRLYDSSYTLLSEFKADDCITSLLFTPDGGTLYASTATGNIAVLKADAETRVIMPVVTDEIYGMDISPDGKTLAAAYGDSNVRLFDTETGRLINRTCVGSLAAICVQYSPDGKMIAVSGNSGNVLLITPDGKKILAGFWNSDYPHSNYDCVTFNSDGTKLFAAGNAYDFYSAVIAWDVPEGIVTEEEYADFAPVTEALVCADELKYTADSFAGYSEALKNAEKVLQNIYSSQDDINAAAKALSDAVSALEEKPDVMKGDFDGDGQITVADALAALRIAAKLAAEDAASIAVGDIDGDAHVTVADALAILRVAAKLADSL